MIDPSLQPYVDYLTEQFNQHRDVALTLGGMAGGIALSSAFNGYRSHRENARIRRSAHSNQYDLSDVYVTETYYRKTRDINPETGDNFWDQVTDPHFFGANDEIKLRDIFHQSTGDILVNAIKKTMRNHKDEPIILSRMKDKLTLPKNESLWSHKQRSWVLFFRAYYGSLGRAQRLFNPLHDNERYTSHTVYPLLVDEPGALHRQGKVIVISQTQLDAGIDALPDIKNVRVLKNGVYQYAPDHHMMQRYHTVRHAIEQLNHDTWLRNAVAATYEGVNKEFIFTNAEILKAYYGDPLINEIIAPSFENAPATDTLPQETLHSGNDHACIMVGLDHC